MSTSSLQHLLDQLPFDHNDFEAANAAFLAWHNEPTRENERVVHLWAYAYVMMYFTRKRTIGDIDSAADTTEAITRAFERVQNNLDTVRHPSRFAGWVSVICKNTFLNHLRAARDHQSIEEKNLEFVDDPPDASALDSVFLLRLVKRAIRRLPDYLQETARLYFIDDCSFQQISDAIGKPVGTVRVYKQRATHHLQKDHEIRQIGDLPPQT